MRGVKGASHTHSLAGPPQYQAEGLGTRLHYVPFSQALQTDVLSVVDPSLS